MTSTAGSGKPIASDGFDEIHLGAQGHGKTHILILYVGRGVKYERDRLQDGIPLDFAQELEPVHDRHERILYSQVGNGPLRRLQSIEAVFRLNSFMAVFITISRINFRSSRLSSTTRIFIQDSLCSLMIL